MLPEGEARQHLALCPLSEQLPRRAASPSPPPQAPPAAPTIDPAPTPAAGGEVRRTVHEPRSQPPHSPTFRSEIGSHTIRWRADCEIVTPPSHAIAGAACRADDRSGPDACCGWRGAAHHPRLALPASIDSPNPNPYPNPSGLTPALTPNLTKAAGGDAEEATATPLPPITAATTADTTAAATAPISPAEAAKAATLALFRPATTPRAWEAAETKALDGDDLESNSYCGICAKMPDEWVFLVCGTVDAPHELCRQCLTSHMTKRGAGRFCPWCRMPRAVTVEKEWLHGARPTSAQVRTATLCQGRRSS